jgi:hypothetical protein
MPSRLLSRLPLHQAFERFVEDMCDCVFEHFQGLVAKIKAAEVGLNAQILQKQAEDSDRCGCAIMVASSHSLKIQRRA